MLAIPVRSQARLAIRLEREFQRSMPSEVARLPVNRVQAIRRSRAPLWKVIPVPKADRVDLAKGAAVLQRLHRPMRLSFRRITWSWG